MAEEFDNTHTHTHKFFAFIICIDNSNSASETYDMMPKTRFFHERDFKAFSTETKTYEKLFFFFKYVQDVFKKEEETNAGSKNGKFFQQNRDLRERA